MNTLIIAHTDTVIPAWPESFFIKKDAGQASMTNDEMVTKI
jgi:hypothetical protein